MRRDWNARAAEDAEYYVRTPDESGTGFDESGRISYEEEIQPFLDLLLDGKPSAECRMVEIGCGIGRMTRWAAQHFGEVHGLDISQEMLARARDRVRDCPNVTLYLGSGGDLAGLPDAYFDLAFSYIVFQHIPSREIIEAYVRDAVRVLRPGGAFRFQVSGFSTWEYRRQPKDSWLGESYSLPQALDLLQRTGLQPLHCQGAGTQYLWIAARKPRNLGDASRDVLLKELAERKAWQENLNAELNRLDVEPPEIAELARAKKAVAVLQSEFDERTRWAQKLETDLAAAREQLEAQQRNWDGELGKARNDLSDLQRAFEERTAWCKSLEEQLEQALRALADLQREFQERTAWAQSLEAELTRARADFADLQKAFDERTAWALEMRDELERRKP